MTESKAFDYIQKTPQTDETCSKKSKQNNKLILECKLLIGMVSGDDKMTKTIQ